MALIWNGEKVLGNLKEAYIRGLNKGGQVIVGDMKKKAPVDTGYLRNSNDFKTAIRENEAELIVGNNAEYAPYVELGTRKQKAQPFLEPSVQENIDNIKALISNEIKNAK